MPKYPESFREGVFFKVEFNLSETGDIYFDLKNFVKGMVYVNGHNLGPQQRLYCPAVWLRKGKNQIIIFDLHKNDSGAISGSKTME